MLVSSGVVFLIVLVFLGFKILGAFTAISARKTFNFGNLANLGTKLLGYKELYDIVTDNNKNDYSDMVDNLASSFLGKHRNDG